MIVSVVVAPIARRGLVRGLQQRHALRCPVRLRQEAEPNASYDAKTDEHGFYDFNVPSLGRFELTISASGFQTYTTEVYLSSDVMANLPVQLKSLNKPR